MEVMMFHKEITIRKLSVRLEYFKYSVYEILIQTNHEPKELQHLFSCNSEEMNKATTYKLWNKVV